MYRILLAFIGLAVFILPVVAQQPTVAPPPVVPAPAMVSKIVFGSCFKVQGPHDIWDAIGEENPDLTILLGDNIYGDTEDMGVLAGKYAKLGAVRGYAALRERCMVLATWDDHDYGRNDAGAEFPKKAESQRIFLDFFGEPRESERRRTPGVYNAKVFGPEGRRVQVILLDTRTSRSPLKHKTQHPTTGAGRPGTYAPNDDRAATILGETQWTWLEEQLQVPADVRIIATSIQFVAEDHGYEKWANFPRERQRMLDLLRDTRARGVVFISGDRHSAELSVQRTSVVGYPMHDITSSSLNSPRTWTNEINRHRVGTPFFDANYGVIEVQWDAPEPALSLIVRDSYGATMIRHDLPIATLRPR
ncbi:MAG: alkaline phosphatase D family protein [Planctomycetota bacterium]